MWNLLPQPRKAVGVRGMSGQSLNGGTQSPLHEAIYVKPGLPRTIQEAADDIGSLPRTAAHQE